MCIEYANERNIVVMTTAVNRLTCFGEAFRMKWGRAGSGSPRPCHLPPPEDVPSFRTTRNRTACVNESTNKEKSSIQVLLYCCTRRGIYLTPVHNKHATGRLVSFRPSKRTNKQTPCRHCCFRRDVSYAKTRRTAVCVVERRLIIHNTQEVEHAPRI